MPPHRRSRQRRATATALLACTLAACSAGERDSTSISVERDTIGDTVVVRTLAGSVWGDSARLIEEMRIGDLHGGDEYTFGRIEYIAVSPTGTMYVYDGAMRALRAYDADGRYLRTIGAEGGGPGEYESVIGLAVLRDGRLILLDLRLGRIGVYTAGGEPAGAWPFPPGLFSSDMLRTDTAGYVYVKILTGSVENLPPGAPWPMGYARLDTTGTVIDTLEAPRWPEQVGNPGLYGPTALWTWHPFGYFAAAYSARYGVDLHRPGEPVLHIERANQPTIPIPSGERQELEERIAEMRRIPGIVQTGAERGVPEVKPAIRSLATGQDGRIWVRPYMPSIERTEPVDSTASDRPRPSRWTEPAAWDVFEPDGTFLGRVQLPKGAGIVAMRGDTIWGTVLDDDDVPYVVRWRIEPDTARGS